VREHVPPLENGWAFAVCFRCALCMRGSEVKIAFIIA